MKFASIDMGTNSFRLLILSIDPSTKTFFPLENIKEPVVLSLESSTSISPQSHLRALQSLHRFKQLIISHNVSPNHIRCVATAAVREAENRRGFVQDVFENVGFTVDVLSGEEEARLIYLGVVQLRLFYGKRTLCVDIGGGSTEFVVGFDGDVRFAASLKLGHVNLTNKFVRDSLELEEIRGYIRMVITESGLVDRVNDCGSLELVVGSSGTIRAIEKAVFYGYGDDGGNSVVPECKRDWRFSRVELMRVVERLCGGGEEEKVRRDRFFKRRSEFIVVGAVLLEEIFEVLGIEEMEVSEYGLGEGVIAESLSKVFDGYDLSTNARWRSVMRVATRFNGKKRMKSSVQCAKIAKEIFEGLSKCDELSISLDDKDLEYLEAACLLHNIGMCMGKKGYHKHSYHIIKNGDHLQGYTTEEVKLISLLTRHHRRKFPRFDRDSLKDFSDEAKKKLRVMCLVIRIAVILQRSRCTDLQEVEFSETCENFKLTLKQLQDQPHCTDGEEPVAKDMESQLMQDLERFKTLFNKELIVVSSKESERL